MDSMGRVWGGVSPPKSGVGSGIQSKAHQDAPQRLNPRNTLWKKSGVDTPVHPLATPLQVTFPVGYMYACEWERNCCLEWEWDGKGNLCDGNGNNIFAMTVPFQSRYF